MQTMFDKRRPVFIIGGGPSLRTFHWNRLKRHQTIALNLAYRPVNFADVLFFSTNRFLEQYGDPSGQHFYQVEHGKVITTAAHAGGCMGGKANRLLYVNPDDLAIAKDNLIVSALDNCTGAQAIMLAHQLGAGKIVLLGFDNKPGHWAKLLGKHYAYPRQPDPEVFEAYADQFWQIAQLDLDVVNATPGSALDCFPIVDLSTVL